MNMVGSDIFASGTTVQVKSYWRVDAIATLPVRFLLVERDKNGQDHFCNDVFPGDFVASNEYMASGHARCEND